MTTPAELEAAMNRAYQAGDIEAGRELEAAFEAASTPAPDQGPMPEDGGAVDPRLTKLRQQTAAVQAMGEGDPGTFADAFSKGALFNYDDELAGVMGGAYEVAKGGDFDAGYDKYRRWKQDTTANYRRRAPVADFVGQVAGGAGVTAPLGGAGGTRAAMRQGAALGFLGGTGAGDGGLLERGVSGLGGGVAGAVTAGLISGTGNAIANRLSSLRRTLGLDKTAELAEQVGRDLADGGLPAKSVKMTLEEMSEKEAEALRRGFLASLDDQVGHLAGMGAKAKKKLNSLIEDVFDGTGQGAAVKNTVQAKIRNAGKTERRSVPIPMLRYGGVGNQSAGVTIPIGARKPVVTPWPSMPGQGGAGAMNRLGRAAAGYGSDLSSRGNALLDMIRGTLSTPGDEQ